MTDLRVKRGDSIVLAVGPVTSGGVVQNITGQVIRFTAKAKLSDLDAAAIIAGSTVDGRVTITNGPAGLARVNIPGNVTDAIAAPRTLVWDIQIAEPIVNGVVKTLDSGKLLIEPDVTRATT